MNNIENKYFVSGIRLYAPIFFAVFILITIEVVEFLSPFSGYGNEISYYWMMLLYLLAGLLIVIPFGLFKYNINKSFALVKKNNWTVYLSIIAFLGIVMIVFDRILIQGVDYTQGFSQARESWRAISSTRSGVSSIFSVIGNLLYPFVFISIVLNVVFYEVTKNPFIKILFSFLVVILFSLVIGGRTSVLIFFAIIISSIATRIMLGNRAFPKKIMLKMLLILFSGIIFSGLIFYFRIQMSDISFSNYAISLADRHGGYVNTLNNVSDSNAIQAIWHSIAIYFIHVKWVFQSILVDGAELYGNAFLNQIVWVVSSRGGVDFSFIGFELDWDHKGKWISLPGAVWHDYGVFGVALISIFLYSVYFLFVISLLNMTRFSLEIKYCLIIAATVYFSFFIFSPFVSLLSVVEFIYLVFDIVLITYLYLFRDFIKVLFK